LDREKIKLLVSLCEMFRQRLMESPIWGMIQNEVLIRDWCDAIAAVRTELDEPINEEATEV
jgi:hypothetical protein